MADIDKSNPQDDGIVSQYPSNERSSRSAIEQILAANHKAGGDTAEDGKHELVELLAQSAPAAVAGQGFFYTKDIDGNGTIELFFLDEAGNESQITNRGTADGFASGTRMAFHMPSAPIGWTQDTGFNDAVFRVSNGNAGGGHYSSATISFDGTNNEINDSNADFVAEDFAAGQPLTVTGTSNNDGDYTIASVTATTIAVNESLTDEASGTTFTLTGVGGSQSIVSMSTKGHALTVSEMPSHDHGGGGSTGTTTPDVQRYGWERVSDDLGDTDYSTPYGVKYTDGNHMESNATWRSVTSSDPASLRAAPHTHSYQVLSEGGDNAHSHNIDPRYTDFMIAEKD